jgi:hypothetical protein
LWRTPSWRSDLVLDPFAGSGSTIVATEPTNGPDFLCSVIGQRCRRMMTERTTLDSFKGNLNLAMALELQTRGRSHGK